MRGLRGQNGAGCRVAINGDGPVRECLLARGESALLLVSETRLRSRPEDGDWWSFPTGIYAIVDGWEKLTVRIAGRTDTDCGVGILGLALELGGQLKQMAANVS
jgi:hypothetical protein